MESFKIFPFNIINIFSHSRCINVVNIDASSMTDYSEEKTSDTASGKTQQGNLKDSQLDTGDKKCASCILHK